MPVLEVENLVVEFPVGRGAIRVVDGISLAVDRGEVLAIVGESGSGKSIAMLAVMGLLPPTARVFADRMRLDGQDLQDLPARRRRALLGRDVTMIFQEPMSSLNPSYTVGFQIDEVLRFHTDLGRRQRRSRCVELLQAVGLPEPEARLRLFPHQLSGGQCQRVMIAMAIACRPKLLIADEPTTALDVTVQKQILDLLLSLQARDGMALVLITHDMGVVAETADRVSVQYQGRTMEQTDVLSLFTAPASAYTKALLASVPGAARGGRLRTVQDSLAGEAGR